MTTEYVISSRSAMSKSTVMIPSNFFYNWS